jgi:EAL domain-containing protein (putative c-di-GMP-specific phosphodiesterase class I)
MPTTRHSSARTVRGLLRTGGLRAVFQPIVDLDVQSVVGYESLARGPVGSPLEQPIELFAAARAEGLLAELDAACRELALRAAVDSGRLAPLTVFVNVEPEVLDGAPLHGLQEIAGSAPRHLPVVFEITERSIASRPAALLRTVDRIREYGWSVALDDVGADARSLAFLSLLRPEVVKLDLRLIQQRSSAEIARIMHAVNAYTESSGALLLAEGIETDEQLDAAHALGARFGQGWLFGRPSGEPSTLPIAEAHLTRAHVESPPTRSPFACLPPHTPLRRGDKRLLIELSKRLELEALAYCETAIVASTFQESHHFTSGTAVRYQGLVDETAFVCVFAEGALPAPIPGLREGRLSPGDPLAGEWDVIVLTTHFAAALLARDLGGGGPDLDRVFEYALTYRREIVVRAASALLSRVEAAEAW